MVRLLPGRGDEGRTGAGDVQVVAFRHRLEDAVVRITLPDYIVLRQDPKVVIQATVTGRTSHIAVELASDKADRVYEVFVSPVIGAGVPSGPLLAFFQYLLAFIRMRLADDRGRGGRGVWGAGGHRKLWTRPYVHPSVRPLVPGGTKIPAGRGGCQAGRERLPNEGQDRERS